MPFSYLVIQWSLRITKLRFTVMSKGIVGVFFMVMAALLSGCGEKAESESKTQVAARVNGEEITVHQLNQALMAVGNRAASLDKQAVASDLLDSLITQSILVQEAGKAKLNRDPVVMQALEAAKRKVLADAFIQRTMGQAPHISANEVADYYLSRKELFSERKMFSYQQLTLNAQDVTDMPAVISKLKEIERLNELIVWLKQQNINYSVNPNSKTSEKLPPALLKPLMLLKEGDVGFLKMDDGLLVIELTSVVKQAVSLSLATPAIKQYLTAQAYQKQLKQRIKALREVAAIEYMGDFKIGNTVRDNEAKAEPIEAERHDGSHIEKGLQGLK